MYISGWWLSPTPLKNDRVKVSWDDDIPNVPNHQPDIYIIYNICFLPPTNRSCSSVQNPTVCYLLRRMKLTCEPCSTMFFCLNHGIGGTNQIIKQGGRKRRKKEQKGCRPTYIIVYTYILYTIFISTLYLYTIFYIMSNKYNHNYNHIIIIT